MPANQKETQSHFSASCPSSWTFHPLLSFNPSFSQVIRVLQRKLHQSALNSPPVSNLTPLELLPFMPLKGPYGYILGTKWSFAAFTATSSLLPFLPLSGEVWGFLKNLPGLILNGFSSLAHALNNVLCSSTKSCCLVCLSSHSVVAI